MQKAGMMKAIGSSLFMVIIGASILCYYYSGASKAKATCDWPSVQGVVLDSGLFAKKEARRRSGDKSLGKDFVNLFIKRRIMYYNLRIEYQYEVDGETYQSKVVSPLGTIITEEKRDYYDKNYAPKHHVDVFYNPDDPSDAVLITGVQSYNLSPRRLWAYLFILLGLLGLLKQGYNVLFRRGAWASAEHGD